MSEDVKNLAKVYHNMRSILSSTPSSPALLPEGEGSSVWKNKSVIQKNNKVSGKNIKPSPSGRGLGEGAEIYEDIPGFYKSSTIEDVIAINYALTPGR